MIAVVVRSKPPLSAKKVEKNPLQVKDKESWGLEERNHMETTIVHSQIQVSQFCDHADNLLWVFDKNIIDLLNFKIPQKILAAIPAWMAIPY